MRQLFFPLGLALAGTLLAPLSATAIPIEAANGVADSVPGSAAGPRHPGVISLTKTSVEAPSPFKASGRPVPGTGLRTLAEVQPL